MKYSRNEHSFPIGDDYELSKCEYKVLDWFLSYGRACLTLFFLFSLFCFPWVTVKCWSILSEYRWLLLLWSAVIVIASIYALPILVLTIKCLLQSLSPKHKIKTINGQILGAALLGWDRFYKKPGRKEFTIEKASDIWVCDDAISESLINYTIEKLKYFNTKEKVEPKYRATCYNCFFEAAYDAGIIRKDYCTKGKLRPVVIEQFLTLLGSDYQMTAQNFSRSKEQIVRTSDKICHYKVYKNEIKSEIDKLLTNSEI